jgi:hypothetical protein
MENHSVCSAKALTAVLLCGITAVSPGLCPRALAEPAPPPARIANIYGGLNHQPKRAEAERLERAAGFEPSARRRSQDDAALRGLYVELIQKAGAS